MSIKLNKNKNKISPKNKRNFHPKHNFFSYFYQIVNIFTSWVRDIVHIHRGVTCELINVVKFQSDFQLKNIDQYVYIQKSYKNLI